MSKIIIEIEAKDGDCKLYQNFNPRDSDSACKTCPLNKLSDKVKGHYCMDYDMHEALVTKMEVRDV